MTMTMGLSITKDQLQIIDELNRISTNFKYSLLLITNTLATKFSINIIIHIIMNVLVGATIILKS